MHIAVLVKEVPDTETRFQIDDGEIDYSDVNYVINPYDEFAYEEAIRVKEELGEDEVELTAVSLSTEGFSKELLNVLAVGVDELVHINDPEAQKGDPLASARVLQPAIEELDPDLILGGKVGVDYDYGQTAVILAERLGWPHVSEIDEFELTDGSVRVERSGDVGVEVHEAELPAVITCDKALNEPRYANLKGIMSAKKKPQHEKSLDDLGVDASAAGESAAEIEYLEHSPPPEKEAGEILEGETVEEKVDTLVTKLKEEAKVI